MVGGTAAVLSRPRVFALGGLLASLAAYAALAERLPDLPDRADLAVVALLVMPASMGAVWLALPLTGIRRPHLLIAAAAIVGLLAIVLELAGVDSAANVAKLACFTLAGLWFVTLFEELWWVTLVAAVVPWMDVWSVAFGPTRYVVEERPGFFEEISVGFAVPADGGTVNLGPPDVIFFALFLAAAARFQLRLARTWFAMTGLLALTLILVWEWDVFGLPALPAVCLGFLLPNADLLWRDALEAWRERRNAEPAG